MTADLLNDAITPLASTYDFNRVLFAAFGPGVETDASYHLAPDGLYEVDAEPVWFQAASSGKHLTAWAIGLLAEAGKLNLDDPVGSILTELNIEWGARPIRSLLNHTSGLPEYLLYVEGEDVPTDRATFMAKYTSQPCQFAPNAAWSYSNTNYILLGFVIAQVSGISYSRFITQQLKELGLSGIAVATPQWTRERNSGKRTDQPEGDAFGRTVIGDGDIAFTADGALGWLRFLSQLQGDRSQTGEAVFEPARFTTGRLSMYAGGLFREPFQRGTISYHAGHYDGWTAMIYLNHETASGCFAITDQAPKHTRNIRGFALGALEALVPGSTPHGIRAMSDTQPALTQTARDLFCWSEKPATDEHFAEEMLPAYHATDMRGLYSLAPGRDLHAFTLVDQGAYGDAHYRRYRTEWSTGVEHLLTGLSPEGKLYWGWPL